MPGISIHNVVNAMFSGCESHRLRRGLYSVVRAALVLKSRVVYIFISP